jgi:hypothetical protein
MNLQILDLARDDLIEGFHFYERREAGLGRRFLDCLYLDIESLAKIGGIHRKPHRTFHRVLSKKYPFAIYYTVADQSVQISLYRSERAEHVPVEPVAFWRRVAECRRSAVR